MARLCSRSARPRRGGRPSVAESLPHLLPPPCVLSPSPASPHMAPSLLFCSTPRLARSFHPSALSSRCTASNHTDTSLAPVPAQDQTRSGPGLRPCEAWPGQARPRSGHAWPGPGLARPGQARAMPRQARQSQSKPGQVRAWPNLVGTQARPWQYEARQGPGKGHRQASQDKPRPGHSRPGPDQAKPGQNRTKAGQVSSGQSQARIWSGRARTKTRDWPGQGLGQARRGHARL